MEDNEYRARLFKYGTVALCVLIVSCFASCQVTTIAIATAIHDGANPVLARCAISGTGDGSRDQIMCIEALKK